MKRNSERLWLGGLCLAGWVLRLPLLARFPLREDEAVYAYWARHFLHEDPFFLTVWPDKPPLFLWSLAGLLALLQPVDARQAEAVARLLNVAASTLTIPVVAVLARRWWGVGAGLGSALGLALSPFAVAFAPTVYTDPLLVLAGMLAVLCGAYGRWFWAGVWLAAAIMTKQQGLFYVPLIVGQWAAVGLWAVVVPVTDRHMRWRALGRLLAGAALVLLPIVYWDSLRWAVAPSPWDLAQRTYGPIELVAPALWRARLAAWSELLWYLGAAWRVWLVWGAALLAGLALAWRNRRAKTHTQTRAPVGAVIALWSCGFVLLHVGTTVQIWDRYLLPLAPMFALGLGWAWRRLASLRVFSSRHALHWLGVLVALALAQPAWHAAQGRYPVGGDHGDYAGLHGALQWLDANAGANASENAGERYTLYHQALGWHYRFYLFDDLRAGRVELRWFPSAPYLADNAAKLPNSRQFLILPAWAPQPHLAVHLPMRRLALATRHVRDNFRVVEILHTPQPYCEWCTCRIAGSSLRTSPGTSPRWSSGTFPGSGWQLAPRVDAGMMSQP